MFSQMTFDLLFRYPHLHVFPALVSLPRVHPMKRVHDHKPTHISAHTRTFPLCGVHRQVRAYVHADGRQHKFITNAQTHQIKLFRTLLHLSTTCTVKQIN